MLVLLSNGQTFLSQQTLLSCKGDRGSGRYVRLTLGKNPGSLRASAIGCGECHQPGS